MNNSELADENNIVFAITIYCFKYISNMLGRVASKFLPESTYLTYCYLTFDTPVKALYFF